MQYLNDSFTVRTNEEKKDSMINTQIIRIRKIPELKDMKNPH